MIANLFRDNPPPWTVTREEIDGYGGDEIQYYVRDRNNCIIFMDLSKSEAQAISLIPDMYEALKHAAHTINSLEKELAQYRSGSYSGAYKIEKLLKNLEQ